MLIGAFDSTKLTHYLHKLATDVERYRDIDVFLIPHEGRKVRVRGIDMLNGTPILDIKPYMSGIPTENLRLGWFAEAEARRTKLS